MTDSLATPPADIQRVAFLGTPDVSEVALQALVDADFDVALVVSRPDRRRGRGSKLIPSPVKQRAIELGLEVSDDLEDLRGLNVDLGVVVAYGRIIPVSLLQELAMINIHFSLLPRWRGAAPVERAILAGDGETGVCLIEVAEGLDEGAVYAKATTGIGHDESAAELRARLAVLGADLLVEQLRAGLGQAEPQVGEITYAAKMDKAEAKLDFERPAVEAHRIIRVSRAWTEFRGKRLGIERALLHPGVGASGALNRAMVATPEGMLELVTVKPEGKRAMPALDWSNGVQPQPGERLG